MIWTPAANTPDLNYLRFQNEITMQQGYLTERMKFWSEEVPKIAFG